MFGDLIDQVRKLALWGIGASVVGLGYWAYPTIKDHLSSVQATTNQPTTPAISVAQVASLIAKAEPNRSDPKGWATDLLEVLKSHHLPQTRENACAVIAVVDQESGFVANPPVPNLGRLSEKAVIDKLNQIPLLAGQAESYLNRFPTPEQSFMQRIRSAHTERDLDLAYRDLIAALIKQYKLRFMLNNGFGRDLIEGQNEIDTIGSMQVAVSFAVQYEIERRGGKQLSLEEVYKVRDFLYTRKGGLFYGTLLLLGYDSGYDKKIYRFADFNAGRYSSRNAAFQQVISELSGKPLSTDGDLMIYSKSGVPSTAISSSEQVVRLVVKNYSLGLTDTQIRSDLMLEKTYRFRDTTTYKTMQQIYAQAKKRKPPYAIVPKITLKSEKTSRILTTEKFANTVYGRYQKCMAQ